MIELLGSVGWGLLLLGAVTHTWHHARLRLLLAMHFDHERVPALALTSAEVGLAIALPAAWLLESGTLKWFALAAFAMALLFVVWIARLLLSGSNLPCACSFSDAPTSWWSLARAGCVALVGLLALASAGDDAGLTVGTLAVGWALAAGIFVLPEAITWPEASKALMARVDAYAADAAGAAE